VHGGKEDRRCRREGRWLPERLCGKSGYPASDAASPEATKGARGKPVVPVDAIASDPPGSKAAVAIVGEEEASPRLLCSFTTGRWGADEVAAAAPPPAAAAAGSTRVDEAGEEARMEEGFCARSSRLPFPAVSAVAKSPVDAEEEAADQSVEVVLSSPAELRLPEEETVFSRGFTGPSSKGNDGWDGNPTIDDGEEEEVEEEETVASGEDASARHPLPPLFVPPPTARPLCNTGASPAGPQLDCELM